MLQVPTKVLQKYRIVKVDAPEAGVSLFVVRNRPGSTSLTDARDTLAGTKTHPGTEAEVAAAYKSCRVSSWQRFISTIYTSCATLACCEWCWARTRHLKTTCTVQNSNLLTAGCSALQDLGTHHQHALVKPIWKHAGDYFTAYRNLGRRCVHHFRLGNQCYQ